MSISACLWKLSSHLTTYFSNVEIIFKQFFVRILFSYSFCIVFISFHNFMWYIKTNARDRNHITRYGFSYRPRIWVKFVIAMKLIISYNYQKCKLNNYIYACRITGKYKLSRVRVFFGRTKTTLTLLLGSQGDGFSKVLLLIHIKTTLYFCFRVSTVELHCFKIDVKGETILWNS